MPPRVEFSDRANQGLERLPLDTQLRVLGQITRLLAAPRGPGSSKLEDFDNVWRVRAGDYRIAYTLHEDDELIQIEQVGHRRDFYERLRRLPHLR